MGVLPVSCAGPGQIDNLKNMRGRPGPRIFVYVFVSRGPSFEKMIGPGRPIGVGL